MTMWDESNKLLEEILKELKRFNRYRMIEMQYTKLKKKYEKLENGKRI